MMTKLDPFKDPQDQELYSALFNIFNAIIKLRVYRASPLKIKVNWKKFREIKRAANVQY